jgi:hypothetical protein
MSCVQKRCRTQTEVVCLTVVHLYIIILESLVVYSNAVQCSAVQCIFLSFFKVFKFLSPSWFVRFLVLVS